MLICSNRREILWGKLLRRDEINFYEDYMNKYFISQYGAIKDIDFTPVFEELKGREREA